MSWSSGYNFYLGGIVTDGKYLYAATTDTITRTDLSSGVILDSSWAIGFNELRYLAISGDNIFATDKDPNTGFGIIWKIPINAPTTRSQWFVFNYYPDNNLQGLAVLGNVLYFCAPHPFSIYGLSGLLDSSGNVIFSDNIYETPIGICGDPTNNFLYISTTGPNSIYKVDPSNINNNGQVIALNSRPGGLVLYGNTLYVATYDSTNGGYVQKYNLDTRQLEPAWKSVPYANGLCISNTDLYCSDINRSLSMSNSNYRIGSGSIYKFSLNTQITCFKEGSKILTNNGYKLVEELRKGDLIKTLKNGYKKIDMIATKKIYHPASQERIKDQLYKCTQSKYPEVFEDLIITGCHSILVGKFENPEQREKTIEVNSRIFVTDGKYRLPACVDDRTSVYEKPGTYTIYHFALENEDYYMNYGVFANGLLVETCSKRYLREIADMILIE